MGSFFRAQEIDFGIEPSLLPSMKVEIERFFESNWTIFFRRDAAGGGPELQPWGMLELSPSQISRRRPAAPVGVSVLRAPSIGGHRKLLCRKTMLPFESNQAPLYRVSRQNRVL